MRTLQIIGDTTYGGGSYFLQNWCRYLLAKGCQVDLLGTDPTELSALRPIQGLRLIESIHIPRDIRPLGHMRAFGQLMAFLRKNSYDVVHTYTSTPGFLGRISARLSGVPVIVHRIAGWPVTAFSSPLERMVYTPLEYVATLASTRSICVSHAEAQMADEFHIAPRHKLVTICSGIDPQPFIAADDDGAKARLRRELGLPESTVLLGNTGRLAPQKDNETLIRSLAYLEPLLADVPWQLVLAGVGPEQAMLEALADSLGLRERVHFLGFRRDIAAFLAGIDIFISPSLWEGLSISLFEAMAAAKPIVTTTILPNAELIQHETTGLLVPPRAPEQVAQAVARFVREPELARRCATAARQRVLNEYAVERSLQATWDLYCGLLERRYPVRAMRTED